MAALHVAVEMEGACALKRCEITHQRPDVIHFHAVHGTIAVHIALNR